QARNRLDERPIDILFIGTRAPRRDKALLRLQELTDRHRFICVYRSSSEPITEQSVAAAEQSWVLAQRAKIVLNVHRDWIGYFEWPRIVMHGFWQGVRRFRSRPIEPDLRGGCPLSRREFTAYR